MKLAERYLRKLENTRPVSAFTGWDSQSKWKDWRVNTNGVNVILKESNGMYIGTITSSKYTDKIIGNTMLESKGDNLFRSKRIVDGPCAVCVEAKYVNKLPESVSYNFQFSKGTEWNQVITMLEKYLSVMTAKMSEY